MRMIDADAMLAQLKPVDYEAEHSIIFISDTSKIMREWVKCQPTLTPPNEWIGVKDRLPEDDAPAGRKQITVMVATKAGKVTIASRVFEPERECCGKVYPARWIWSRWLNNYVTHWMPLPAPPGKE